MAVAGVSVRDARRDAGIRGEAPRDVQRFGESRIRHRPVGADLAAAERSPGGTAFVHRGRHRMAQMARLAQGRGRIVHANVGAGRAVRVSEFEPRFEWQFVVGLRFVGAGLLDIHHGRGVRGPTRAAFRCARDVHRADLVLFPELALSGYPPEDLLLRRSFYAKSDLALQALAADFRVAGGGSLLFTGGGLADHPTADYASLSLCKAALKSLTHTLAQEYGVHGIHVATVTVHGFVQQGTHFDPHLIAQSFIKLHRQPKGRFDIELVYR